MHGSVAAAPERTERICRILRNRNGGFDKTFATRMRGSGVFADVPPRQFRLPRRTHGITARASVLQLENSRFGPPDFDREHWPNFAEPASSRNHECG